MKALIITKPTNLEQHGDVVRSQIRRQRIDAFHIEDLKQAHKEHYEALDAVRVTLKNFAIDFDEISRGDRATQTYNYDLIVSIGGDGTLLSASHRIRDSTPVIGIRSSQSSVGYLCAGGFAEITAIFEAFRDASLKFEACARLRANIYYAEEDEERQTVPVLNDFLFANHNPSATTRYRITCGSAQESHKSSGVWIATATGSTAAIRAAGGMVMNRHDTRFQFRVRELYLQDKECSSVSSGFFDPDKEEFSLDSLNEIAVLALDGQRGVIPLRFGDRIRFVRAPAINIALPVSI